MSWHYDNHGAYPEYETVAQKRAKALLEAKRLTNRGSELTPALVKGTKLASSFWGQSWNKNLERYQQYDNRLPRGRSYVRNGMVIHLEVAKGAIKALVSGSSLYKVQVHIEPLHPTRWKTLKSQCAGQISSLISLLQGKIPPAIMQLVTEEKSGLFPEPKDIRFDCSCPDYADLCKHASAALYGVGARLDESPELLFLLRGLDHTELIANATEAVAKDTPGDGPSHSLGDLSDIFGIELDDGAAMPEPSPAPAPKKPRAATKKTGGSSPVSKKKAAASKVTARKASRTPAKKKPSKKK